MRKYISSLVLLIGFSYSLFSQGTQLELDTFNRSIATANFGGQTWRGPSWVDSVFNDSVATMYPDVLAYPPSPDSWDWQNGWFYPQSVLDTCCLDTIVLNWGQLNATVIDITPETFQSALNQIGAEGLYCLNMISSSMDRQLNDLHSAKANGVHLERIRLGDEMGKTGNDLSISHFPTAEDYATTCAIYIDSIRDILPNTKIAVSAGNFGGNSNPRAEFWNEALYNMTNKADAFRWSAFFYLKDADTVFTTKQLLAYPFDQIPTYERVRGFQDTVSNLQDYELWVGYGITDNTSDHRYLNRWSLVLMFSASHNIFLNNKLVEDISMFNVGGIFGNWDALDTQNNHRKRATGIFAAIWNKAKLDKNRTTKIETPIALIDTVTYYNTNNMPRNIEYPKLFGWRFENDSTSEAAVVLTNISEDTLIVSIDSLLVGDVYWEKWHSDSLFNLIDSITHIQKVLDTGLTNIILLPYSINVATEFICNQLVYNSSVSICEGDSIVVGNSVYDTTGVYTDTLNASNGCDSIVYTNISLSPLITWQQVFSICDGDSVIVGNSIYETTGYYTDTLPSTNGCDTIMYTNIFVNYNNTSSYDTVSTAGSYYWGIYHLTSSGDYTDTLTNLVGCDSIAYLNLTISNTTGIIDLTNKKQLVKITDILGQETPYRRNQPLFYIYDDGTVEKRIVIE